jgi:hypothetical protein
MSRLTFSSEHQRRISEAICTPSERRWEQITKWIQSCSLIHDECRTVKCAAVSDESKLPTRLIEIGDVGNLTVRVRETSELQQSEFEEYMTLSHCWGAVVPKKLTKDNYLSMLEGIALSDLPATFLEAVQLTRRLGVRYLWIDSLCIIQDSSEDWGTESVRMFEIYRNSYLNIGAAGALDANGGLFSSLDSRKAPPCVLTIGTGANSRCLASQYEPENSPDKEFALFSRAWVFQELLLAPRTLLLGKDELFWECRRLRGTETIPQQAKHHPGYDGLRMATRELWENLDDQNYQSRLGVWFELVRQYSDKQLTKVSDKLVAVSGLASHLGSTWNDVSYLAGLWSFQLRRGLIWQVLTPQLKKDKTFIAPSWSWASTTGTVIPSGFSLHNTFEENLSELRDGLIEVLDASTTQDSPYSLYGPVHGGQVRIKGPLMRGSILRLTRNSWELDFKDCRAVFSDLEHVLEKIPMVVSWDDWEMDDMTEGINIYLAPFEVHLNSVGNLVLEGLLLSPTHLARGQYRRLGHFSVHDDLLQSQNQDAETGFSQEVKSVQTNDFNDDRAQHVNAKLSAPIHITALDVTAFYANMDKKNKLMGLECSSSSSSGPFQKMKKRLDPWQDCSSLSSKESLNESEDPYWNGAVNPKLANRYHDTLNGFEYERINSFFAALTWTIFKEGLVGGSQVPNEEDHGNNYFTFSIV